MKMNAGRALKRQLIEPSFNHNKLIVSTIKTVKMWVVRGRFAWLTGVERDAALVIPQIEAAQDELGALIDADRFWQA
jgi:hypothetical protein